ncbi:gas vesicle protein [Streptomyces aureoverticillatus]|uniref:gas vesicle protein n=1 Tax=Streptomyces aureoverticillatus TaxID=66871 RepID=UPI0013DABDA4|nr:gas vesicle protein [Streptomyces aureoverticillatus]QIB42634.1 gas vesicle protein [Streptomyces aureoverticillatus]
MTSSADPFAQREIALVDVLDRLLAGGVVLAGDITLRIADVDLVRIDLKALISAVNAQVPSPFATVDDTREPLEPLGARDLPDPK